MSESQLNQGVRRQAKPVTSGQDYHTGARIPLYEASRCTKKTRPLPNQCRPGAIFAAAASLRQHLFPIAMAAGELVPLLQGGPGGPIGRKPAANGLTIG